LGLFALVAGGIGGLFALIHAARLGPNMNLENLIYGYYVAVLFIWIALALALFLNRPLVSSKPMGWASIGYLVLVVLCVLFIDNVNIRIVKADVVYKQGLKFDQEGKWDGAIYFYTKALEIAPEEDFYHLFRGRALMERAKIEEDLKKRDAYFSEALAALTRARQLNPLNTDHTANIARLYRTWGELDPDPNGRREKLQRSLEYYAEATKLSPHSAVLFDEWGLVYYILGDLDQAMAKYEQSLKLDQKFLQTYVYMGDVYLARKQWQEAIPVYQKAVALNPDFVQGWSAMGYVYAQLGAWNEAISANMKVLEVAPRDYSTLKNLAILYNQSERPKEALSYAQRALEVAPEQDKPTLESFVQQLRDKIEKED
jgi:tetratricopeptide (TPR) repeat protein